MTSRNSFWASSKENHKRRVGVWIVAVLGQLFAYAGVLTVYLSRVQHWNADGAYQTKEAFQEELYQAARDALAFQGNLIIVLTGLAVIIGVHGFSYLFDKKKVDLYHSVPVDKNRRFAIVYGNGIVIYLVSTLLSLLIGVIAAAAQGAVNGEVMAAVGLGFVWNLLFFLVMYHTVILAVMLTGNWIIALCAVGVLAAYEPFFHIIVENMQYAFFETTSGFYGMHTPKLSVIYDFFDRVQELKSASNAGEVAREVLPYYGKWVILSVVILAVAWLCYRIRPSEAAGRALAFPRMGAFLKVLVVIPLAAGLGMWVYSSAYDNELMMAAGMAVAAVIGSAVMEVIYDFDIRSLFRHLLSSGVAVAGVLSFFLIFQQDLFGYDDYLPDADEVESVALNMDYYGQFWDENYNYVASSEYSREHMQLRAVEPVLALAEKARQSEIEDMDDPRQVYVLYRLRSGKEISRRFWVDYADPANEAPLNLVLGDPAFQEGTFQIMTDQTTFGQALSVNYGNGAADVALPAEDVQRLREAYVKDMEKFDFSLVYKSRPCGRITFRLPNWFTVSLDVYDSFENTVAYLQSEGAYYPIQLSPEDIADITVTNYHNELNEQDGLVYETYDSYGERVRTESAYAYSEDTTVSEVFSDEAAFEQILPVIYPSYLSTAWNDDRELDDNYDVYITFKKDSSYPYDRGAYGVYYKFYTGEVPEFVKEATALEAQGK